jgi:hypothetical protein
MNASKLQPLLIGGCPRSGTTWIQFLIAAHPDVVTSRETHVFDKYVGPMKEWFDREESLDGGDGLSALFSEKEFLAKFLRPFVRQTFNRIAAAAPLGTETHLLEKTPGNMLHHAVIRQILPSARLLFIVRDPRAVAASFKAASQQDWGSWTRKPVSEVCASWNRYNAAFFEAQERWPARLLSSVRFEDMKMETAFSLARLFDWAGLAHDTQLIEQACAANEIGKLRNEQSDALRADRRIEFYRTGKMHGWATELSIEEIQETEHLCAEYMQRWGYPNHRNAEPGSKPQ